MNAKNDHTRLGEYEGEKEGKEQTISICDLKPEFKGTIILLRGLEIPKPYNIQDELNTSFARVFFKS